MYAPQLSDYGLDDASVLAVHEKVARINKFKEWGFGILFIPVYAIIVASVWPVLTILSLGFALMPSALIAGLIGAILARFVLENRLSAIPGYDALRRFEAALVEYERCCEQVELERQRESARRELERRRRSWEYWANLVPSKFEHEVAELFRKNGYDARVTPGSGDGGIDIVLKKNRSTTFVQCKRHKSKLGPAPIRELYGVMVARRVKRGIVVCPAGFTEGAWKFARQSNIRLVGLKRLLELNDPGSDDRDD